MTMTEDSERDLVMPYDRGILLEAADLIASLRGRVEELTRERDEWRAAHGNGVGRLAAQVEAAESRALAAEAKVWRLEAANDELTNKLTKQIDEWFKVADERRAKVERLERALKPFAAADRAIGDEPGPFRFETRNGHRLIEREDLREAARALSQEVKP